MSKYIHSLDWDNATNEVQRKARIIEDLQARLTWLENEIVKAGGKNDFTGEEELEFELFGVLPQANSLHIERLQNEKLRTKDLLYLESVRAKALAIDEKTKRMFFLIEEQAQYIYDKEQHAVDIGGYNSSFPDWIVPVEGGQKQDELSEDFVKSFLDKIRAEIPALTEGMGKISNGIAGKYYFPAKDLAELIGEIIAEMQASMDKLPDAVDADNKKDGLLALTGEFESAEIAIFHVYLSKFGGQPVTKQNMDSIAIQHQRGSKNSGAIIYREFNKYKQDSERVNIHTSNKKSANNHIKRFEKIIPRLEHVDPRAASAAMADLEQIKKVYRKYYNQEL